MATPNPTGQPEQSQQIIRIWDAPESRIHFLEATLKNKEWEAVVYHPDFAPDGTQRNTDTPLPELARKLTDKGYKTVLGRDENGIPTLQVRNFGSDTTLATSIRELGFARGMTHKITHLGEPLGNAMQKTTDMLKHVGTDKARLIGGLYMIGDLFLIFSGLGNKRDGADGPSAGFMDTMRDPANLLQSAAGVAATIQSLIYMGFAKEGSEAVYAELMGRAKEANKQGKDLLDASLWQQKERSGPGGLLGLPQKLLKNYPIQLGALTQVAGQLGLMTSGGIRLKRELGVEGKDAAKMRMGAVQDMMTATTSVIGWSLLTNTKPKKIDDEDKHPWSDPRRVWQEMSSKPNQYASGFLSAATLSGIAAGRSKNNNIQTMGNLTYLIGDGIMFATNSEHYGAAGMGNSAMLAEAAEMFVKASPVILGEAQQKQFVDQLAVHLAERSLHDEAKKKKGGQEVSALDIKELSTRIAEGLNAKLPRVNERANEAAARIAAVATCFTPEIGRQVVDGLCDAVTGMQGVAIDKAELKAHVERHAEFAREDAAHKPVKIDDVAKPMAALLFAIPGAATPEQVNTLYDIIGAHVQSAPREVEQKLESTINQTAQQDVMAAMQKAPAQNAPAPLGAHTAALAARQQLAPQNQLSH